MNTRIVEIFSAECPICKVTQEIVERLACPSCDVKVIDLRDKENFRRAWKLGVRSVPAVAVSGKLLKCCEGRGPSEQDLIAAGLGQPIFN